MQALTVAEAVEVFVLAFAKVKSRHGEYVARRHEALWIMEDGPGRRRPHRKSEVVALELPPEEAVGSLGRSGVRWHFLVDVRRHDQSDVAAEYKRLGYRKLSTERMFLHDLAAVPDYASDPPARRLDSEQVLASIPQRASQPRRIFEGDDLYCVWDDQTDHGWVERIKVGDCSYPSSLYVHAESRGRGFGRALVSKVLQDDVAEGVRASVVIASADGARLYPHLGYQEAAVLQIFCPKTRG